MSTTSRHPPTPSKKRQAIRSRITAIHTELKALTAEEDRLQRQLGLPAIPKAVADIVAANKGKLSGDPPSGLVAFLTTHLTTMPAAERNNVDDEQPPADSRKKVKRFVPASPPSTPN